MFLNDLLGDPEIEAFQVDELLDREALDLLIAREDKSYSLCDAVNFLVMRREKVEEALTTDRHFEREGFRRLLTPDS